MKVPINNLEYLTKCPLCREKYDYAKTLVLEENNNRTTLHLTCDKCKVATLVFVTTNQGGVVSLGLVTDLEGEEAKKLFKNDAISKDSVIDVHEFLEKYERIEEFIK